MHEMFKENNFSVLGFPSNQFGGQEPLENSEIREHYFSNYGVSFPLFSKIDVNGEDAHPLYRFLTGEKQGLFGGKIKWNYTKFLVDRQGRVVKRFAPTTPLSSVKKHVKSLL